MDLSIYKEVITENDLIIRTYELEKELYSRFDDQLNDIAGDDKYILYYKYYSIKKETPNPEVYVVGRNQNIFKTKHHFERLQTLLEDIGEECFRSVTAYFFEKRTGNYCFQVKMTTGNKYFLLIIDNKLKAYFENNTELSLRMVENISISDRCDEALKMMNKYYHISFRNRNELLFLIHDYFEKVLNYKKRTLKKVISETIDFIVGKKCEMIKEGTTSDFASLSKELQIKILQEAVEKKIHVKDTTAYKEKPGSDEEAEKKYAYFSNNYYELLGLCHNNDKKLIEDVQKIVAQYEDIDETAVKNLEKFKNLYDDDQISKKEFYEICEEIYKRNNSLPVIIALKCLVKNAKRFIQTKYFKKGKYDYVWETKSINNFTKNFFKSMILNQ